MSNEFESAVAAKLAGEQPETQPGEETQAPPPAGEQPAATPAAATPAAAEEQTPAEVTPTEPENVNERIALLEKRLADKDEFIGRQTSEIGELRQVREELNQLRGRVDAPKYDYDALIDEDPATAAELAYQQGDVYHLQAALNAWKDPTTGDPFAAAVWFSTKKNEAELAAVTSHYEQRLGVHDASAQQVELGGVMGSFAQTNPDLEEIAPAMLQVAGELQAEGSPLLTILQTGDAKQKIRVFDYMAKEARARLGAATPAPAPAADDEEAAAAKLAGGALAGGGGGAARELPAEEGDAAREIKQAFREHFGLAPLQ